MANAVVVKGGGYAAVRTALAKKRKRGERGPQQAPTKQLVSVRYSPEVVPFFKATGAGWQARMNDALLEWVNNEPTADRASDLADSRGPMLAGVSAARRNDCTVV